MTDIGLVAIKTFYNSTIKVYYNHESTVKDLLQLILNNYHNGFQLPDEQNVLVMDDTLLHLAEYGDRRVSDVMAGSDKSLYLGYWNPHRTTPRLIIKHGDTSWKMNYQDKTYEITFKTALGLSAQLTVKLTTTGADIKDMIRDQLGIPIDKLTLVFKHDLIYNNCTLDELNFGPDEVGDIVMSCDDAWKDTYQNMPYIFFVKFITGRIVTIRDVYTTTTISELKEQVGDILKIPACSQRIIFGGRSLENDKTLGDYDLKPQTACHLVLCIAAGMCHETSGRNGKYRPLNKISCLYLGLNEQQIDLIKKIKN